MSKKTKTNCLSFLSYQKSNAWNKSNSFFLENLSRLKYCQLRTSWEKRSQYLWRHKRLLNNCVNTIGTFSRIRCIKNRMNGEKHWISNCMACDKLEKFDWNVDGRKQTSNNWKNKVEKGDETVLIAFVATLNSQVLTRGTETKSYQLNNLCHI